MFQVVATEEENGVRDFLQVKWNRVSIPYWGLSPLAMAAEVQGCRVSLLPPSGECDGSSSGDRPLHAFI